MLDQSCCHHISCRGVIASSSATTAGLRARKGGGSGDGRKNSHCGAINK